MNLLPSATDKSLSRVVGRSRFYSRALIPVSNRKSILVIINADDFGISKEVNDAICELLAQKRITSSTVLANGPCVEEAAACVRLFSDVSFGVHLNLTEFEPLTGGLAQHLSALRTLRSYSRIRQLILKPALLRAVYEEWCCQVHRLLSLGFSISHIDSHHHIHTVPCLFPALKAVQRKFNIRRVRISRNVYPLDCEMSPRLVAGKVAFNWSLRQLYATRTTDAFTDFVTFCKCMKGEGNRSCRTIELVVHPGSVDSNEEAELLRSQWQANIYAPVTLIPYRHL